MYTRTIHKHVLNIQRCHGPRIMRNSSGLKTLQLRKILCTVMAIPARILMRETVSQSFLSSRMDQVTSTLGESKSSYGTATLLRNSRNVHSTFELPWMLLSITGWYLLRSCRKTPTSCGENPVSSQLFGRGSKGHTKNTSDFCGTLFPKSRMDV